MGFSSSKLEKELGTSFPASERYLGLENYGNTCYCNSVLQALYYCLPFRNKVIDYYQSLSKKKKDNNENNNNNSLSSSNFQQPDGAPDNLLIAIAQLFEQISSFKRKTGSLAPKKFINRLRNDNIAFRNYNQQDAHEFLIYLINEISEILEKQQSSSTSGATQDHPPPNGTAGHHKSSSFVESIFGGTFSNETKCLCCETVTSRDESFLDLSVDIDQNTSITSCLRNFSRTETLSKEDKFYCDTCCSLQEAQKKNENQTIT